MIPAIPTFWCKTSDPTWQAYNDYGGNSFYTGNPVGRAYKVSYNRPVKPPVGASTHLDFFYREYPILHWLERTRTMSLIPLA